MKHIGSEKVAIVADLKVPANEQEDKKWLARPPKFEMTASSLHDSDLPPKLEQAP